MHVPQHDVETHGRVDVDPVTGIPHEHHDDPDEVPHAVIGVLALSLALIAMFVAVLWLTIGPLAAAIGGAVVAAIAIVRLSRRSAKERVEHATGEPGTFRDDDHDHVEHRPQGRS